MATVLIKIESTQAKIFPQGTIGGLYRFSIVETNLTQDTSDTSVTFTDVPPGNYTASVARLDNVGNLLAPAITTPFEVGVTIDIPTVVSVALS